MNLLGHKQAALWRLATGSSLVAVLAIFVIVSCQQDSGAIAIPTGGGSDESLSIGADGVRTTNDDDRSDGSDDNDERPRLRDDGDDDVEADSDIDFPRFKFVGNGNSTCNGGVGPTIAGVQTSVDGDIFTIDVKDARMFCGSIDRCDQGKVDEELQKSVGPQRYTRVQPDELERLKEDEGFEFGPYAVFAEDVTKNTGAKYSFDKPIPVFPIPAPYTRFNQLDGGKTWTANVTGERSFRVEITYRLVRGDEEEVVIESTVYIPEDTNRVLYEDFPMARRTTYVIDVVKRQIKAMDNLNWWHGDKCDNNLEQTEMSYTMCEYQIRDEVENYRSCTP